MSNYAPTLQMDIYKNFHPELYGQDTEEVYVNYTNRSGRLSNVPGGTKVCHVGVQAFLMQYLVTEWKEGFFDLPWEEAIQTHSDVISSMLGSEANVARYKALHELGYLPLRVKSLPEGTLVPYQVATSTFVNTHKDFYWLPNKIETAFSTDNWGISTAATTAVAYMEKVKEYFEKTGKAPDMIPFMAHNFSMRGSFGREAAAMADFGHLASGFAGTDTIPGVLFAMKYYGADIKTQLVGASVNATEHSVATTNIMYIVDQLGEKGVYVGKSGEPYMIAPVNELLREVMGVAQHDTDIRLTAEYIFMRETLLEFNTGILSYVADSYDFWSVVSILLPALKEEIMARDGKFVIRPDSGDPADILCGDAMTWDSDLNGYAMESMKMGGYTAIRKGGKYFELDPETPYLSKFVGVGGSPENKGLIQALYDTFGGTETSKGFIELDSHIGAIYGDSITLERQDDIYSRLFAKGFCPEPVLGVGSYSYQYVTRDTHGSAVKATNVVKSGRDVEVCKEPKTDIGKKSAKGLLMVDYDADGNIFMKDQCTREEEKQGLLQVVFEDGVLYNTTTLEEIRARVASQI